jgi:hypothetical protein
MGANEALFLKDDLDLKNPGINGRCFDLNIQCIRDFTTETQADPGVPILATSGLVDPVKGFEEAVQFVWQRDGGAIGD